MMAITSTQAAAARRSRRITRGVAWTIALGLAATLVWLALRSLRGANWGSLDTWTVVTAALAAMACALPGVFLVVRRQSMMGDALSHTTLPGIVCAFLFTHWLEQSGWISHATYLAWQHAALFLGALLIGVLSAVLTEWVQKLGRVEASAALGVVFTTLFALGLLLIRLKADQVHIDPDCVLYGLIETTVIEPWPGTSIPRAAVVNGAMLLCNLFLVVLLFKELRIVSFDPALATTLGINATVMHYALMAVTAATLVAAFESVGSILVIAMLIVPAATAHLLTDRLSWLIVVSLITAALSAFLGHWMAITWPALIFGPLGYPEVLDTSTAGMMAVAGGLLFLAAAVAGPRHGLLSKVLMRLRLRLSILGEDILGSLYRREEEFGPPRLTADQISRLCGASLWTARIALRRLVTAGELACEQDVYHFTTAGRERAQRLVRSHRLWESYMAKHFDLPEDHLHATAAQVEHYLSPEMREELAAELGDAAQDPHGRAIPGESV